MKKKNLLFITAISPFPQDSGGATRIQNTIQQLSRYYNLYLISFKNPDYIYTTSDKSKLNKWCKQLINIPIANQKTIGSYLDFGQPYWFSEWYSSELITIIKNLLVKEKIDLIQIEFSQLLYLIDYLNSKDQNKCIFTAHDISTVSFFRRISDVKSILHRLVHFVRFLEIYFYEKKYIPKYRQINTVSENDTQTIKKLFRFQKIVTVLNGIEKVNFLSPKVNKNNQIILGYIGSFSHPPNRTAFQFFVDRIAPQLEKEGIKYKYILAGKNNPEEINFYLAKINPKIRKNIKNIGLVETPKDFFQQIDILITPIFAGSGSRIKILESLSYGKKIISSSVGAEGINIDTKLISIANTPQEYVNEIKAFQHNKNNFDYGNEKSRISELTWAHIFDKYTKYINK